MDLNDKKDEEIVDFEDFEDLDAFEIMEEFDDVDFEDIEKKEEKDEIDDIFEFEDDEDYEEVEDDEEYEEAEDDEDYEEVEDDEEYEEVEDDEEYEEIEDEEDYEEVEDDEEYEEIKDEEDYEEVEDDEEYEEIEDEEDYEEVEDDEEYEEIEDEEDYEKVEDDEEYEEIEDEEDYEEVEDDGEYEEVEDDEEYEEIEDDEEYEEVEEEESEEQREKTEEEQELDLLSNIRVEYIFLGLLLNNPKAISRYYFRFEDCHFSEKELDNMYRIILFRESEQYAPAIAKEGFKLPLEADDSYTLKLQLQEIARERNYSIELVYNVLKKLFILKKHYLLAPTKIIRDNILDIVNYRLYNEMTVEEVESAIEQIGVTSGLSQGVLNEGATSFLLDDENTLATGANLPFPILTSVFKGLRKGETFVYAMPSNSGKSRFTINIASYLAFVEKKKVLIISNEMSVEKMKLCLITTILNNKEYQKLHGQDIQKNESELLDLKFRPDKKKGVKLDDKGFILREEGESMENFASRLKELSTEFNKTIAVTEWLNEQIDNSINFIHVTEHTNEDVRKIIMNYYYKQDVEYIFYDTLKTDTDNIGNSDEIKKTATILSNLAQKYGIFIGSSMQLLESSTLPVNLTINDMSASRTVKEVLDTLCLMKQINPQTLAKYEYSKVETAKEYKDLEVFEDPDVRYYICVVDKNRAGAKPKLLFRLNLAYNCWEELGYVRLKQELQIMD